MDQEGYEKVKQVLLDHRGYITPAPDRENAEKFNVRYATVISGMRPGIILQLLESIDVMYRPGSGESLQPGPKLRLMEGVGTNSDLTFEDMAYQPPKVE